jgi:hypothetical protein
VDVGSFSAQSLTTIVGFPESRNEGRSSSVGLVFRRSVGLKICFFIEQNGNKWTTDLPLSDSNESTRN